MAVFEDSTKAVDRRRARALETLLGDRVVGDQIHMALETAQQPRKGLGVVRLIIDPPQQDVFEADPPAGDGHVLTAILKQGLNRVGVSCGDQLLPQALVGGMQADGQGELGSTQPLERQLGQLGQGAGHTHGAQRDLPLGHAQIGAQAGHGAQHRVDVEQGLAHAHEHHMAGACLHDLLHAEHLVDDLVHGQGALQTTFAGSAEAAGHGATHL